MKDRDLFLDKSPCINMGKVFPAISEALYPP